MAFTFCSASAVSQERIERLDEVAAPGEVSRIKVGKFEHQQADIILELLAGPDKRGRKKIGIQKVLVWLPGSQAVAWQVRKPFDGDFVGDFERKAEILRHLVDHATQVIAVGKFVIGSVDAYGWENFSVFGQAILFEPAFG